MVKLSIITVCKNDAQGLECTIKSVLEQDFKSFQFIIVDGKSTDGTFDIISKYHRNLNTIVVEEDKGIYAAMNKGLQFVQGDYVFFQNAKDTFCNADTLSEIFENNHSEDILYGNIKNAEGKILKDLKGVNLKSYLRKRTIAHQATFVKKEVFQKIGRFDENFKIAGDHEFLVRAILKHNCSFKYIPHTVSIFDQSGVSNRQIDQMKAEKEIIHKKAETYSQSEKRILSRLMHLLTK